MDIEECYSKGFIRKTSIDKELMKSLVKMSESKIIAINSAKIDEITISAYVSMAYDALREILEAICIGKGYKVTSHQCIGELLKTITLNFEYVEFDRMRYIRNGINYYGKEIDLEQGKELLQKILALRVKIKERELKN
ncbi:MAG: hypothetical protein QT08_C0009G0059 [archaeon GW2011_AR17]|nr:MAG: hypothetical protein QT08_C0009G0059 [archaeon GW2011_AR17]MBS3154150.1 hypothetical protein [Candidatus Woesearchaeota archaeon]HIH14812.1 hypothetical protein [Nanoarchaeota archaeon]HIH59036.1 hypothetical protein [Nanoarchaeota archaeon]HII14424.1 hypothetical protein [Nanoarchaeota archaeon]